MRKLFLLCAVGLWVGCGTELESDIGAELADLGTSEAAVCAGMCPFHTYRTGYYCDAGCYMPNCTTQYNANTCTGDVTVQPLTAFDFCGIGCPQNLGFYTYSYTFNLACEGLVNPTSTAPNQSHCEPVPAPGTVTSYTQCGTSTLPCGTGYRQGGLTYESRCYRPNLSGNNAVICIPR